MALAASCSPAMAQSCEFRQGYIFDQKYVERVPVRQAVKLANSPKLFDPLLSFD